MSKQKEPPKFDVPLREENVLRLQKFVGDFKNYKDWWLKANLKELYNEFLVWWREMGT